LISSWKRQIWTFHSYLKKKSSDMRNRHLLFIKLYVMQVCVQMSLLRVWKPCFHSLSSVEFVPLWSLAWNANVSERVGLQRGNKRDCGKKNRRMNNLPDEPRNRALVASLTLNNCFCFLCVQLGGLRRLWSALWLTCYSTKAKSSWLRMWSITGRCWDMMVSLVRWDNTGNYVTEDVKGT